MSKKFDVAIIGGGFYGCCLALYFRKFFKKVLILEKENKLFSQASFVNQARIHNGYHYPRSYLTAYRSHVNFSKFQKDYISCIYSKFTNIYAISSLSSKTSALQFIKFCRQLDLPLRKPNTRIKSLFNRRLIEEVFLTEEVVFDASKITNILEEKLKKLKVSVHYNDEVKSVKQSTSCLNIKTIQGHHIESDYVINCTYAGSNKILLNSGLSTLPVKYELTEVALINMPSELKNLGVTVMDGPFFSTIPYPCLNSHSLTHVRYTPHYSWSDDTDSPTSLRLVKSNFLYMKKDAQRYLPAMADVSYLNSLFTTKAVLLNNENDDGRPILFRKDYGMKNFFVVMGGKIDNIYDIYAVLTKIFY